MGSPPHKLYATPEEKFLEIERFVCSGGSSKPVRKEPMWGKHAIFYNWIVDKQK
jgi:hypothetical protein